MSNPETDIAVREKASSKSDTYGYLRRRVRDSDRNFGELRRSMNQARISTPYDLYIARLIVYAALAALVGAVAGVVTTYMLVQTGFFETVPASIANIYGIVAVGTLVTVTSAAFFGVITGAALYIYPQSVAESRARKINMELPHAIVYMYAMSYGGTNMMDIIKSLADEDETYGEVSNELKYVVRDIEYFGSEMHTSIRKLYEITPSSNLKKFLDDLIGVIESGGDVTVFLEAQGEKYLKEAEDEQAESLETLSIVSEMYLTMFLVAPILVIVMLLVVGVMGTTALAPLYVIVYAVLPAGMVAFIALLGFIEGASPSGANLEREKRRAGIDREKEAPDDERTERHRRRKRLSKIKKNIRHPFAYIRERPWVTLFFSVPLSLVWIWYASSTGLATFAEMQDAPIVSTTYAAVVPLVILFTPYAVFHDLKGWRRKKIVERFPDKLNTIADANKMGLSFTESLKQTSRTTQGYLADELKTTYNDVRWNADTDYALAKFAQRVGVPEVTRTVKLLIESRAATGEIHKVLKIAAKDAQARVDLRKQRRLQSAQHLAIIVLGFFVYLFIILVLDLAFIQPIAEQIGGVELDTADLPAGAAVPIEDIPVDEYRMLFFHSVIVQAVGNGLVAGKIANDDVLSGLKYSVAFLILGTAAFVLFI